MASMTVQSTIDSSLTVASVTGDNTKVNVTMTSGGGTTIAATYSAAAILAAVHNAINTSA